MLNNVVPPVSYNFVVGFGFFNSFRLEDMHFSEISGITAELDFDEKKEGGLNDWVYYLPKGSKASRITLKRGLASMDSALIKWCFDTIHFDNTQVEPNQMIISLLDKNRYMPRMTWAFYNVLPVKWEMSNFDAKESKIAIESIELVFSSMEIMI
jgi:phage tail-like protein